jgi:hypothetical protein
MVKRRKTKRQTDNRQRKKESKKGERERKLITFQ